MSLRSRLFALTTLVLLLSIAVGSFLTYWHSLKKVEVEMQAAVAVGANAVQEAVASLAESPDPESQIRRIIASFDGDRHLKASWTLPDGSVKVTSSVLSPSEPLPEWFFKIFEGQSHVTIVPLPEGLPLAGRIYLSADSHNEVGEVWEDVGLKLLIVAVFSGLVLSLVYLTLGHALRPLEDLSRALVMVGRGDYNAQVSEKGPLELLAIYQEFNRMAAKLADSERQNQRLNEQLMTVQEEERADIARDLHDEFGPFLFSIDVDARTIKQFVETGDSAQIKTGSEAIQQSVAHMQKHLRSILGRLRPTALLDLGLWHALDHLVDFWRKRHPDIALELQVPRESYGARTDDVCYRVVQESISNAVRHGKPKHIDVQVHVLGNETMHVAVSDDGNGLPASGRKGFGLPGMRERISALGGKLTIENRSDRSGVIVLAELPLDTMVNSSEPLTNDQRAHTARTP